MNLYKIVKINEYNLLKLINALRQISKYFLSKKKKKLIQDNKNIRGIESEKSCYILMGGLSVKNINLNDLSKYDVITANHFFRTDDYKKVRPKYHVITDPNFFDNHDNIEDLEKKIQDFTTVFLNIRKTKIIDKSNFKYIYPLFRVINKRINFDISRACSNFSTVTLSCIQIAIFLGYKKIYLVGFDLPPGHMPHYYNESDIEKKGALIQMEKRDEIGYCSLFWQYTNCHHEAYKIQSYASENNIKIYNLSPVSYVRAFPFLKFEES